MRGASVTPTVSGTYVLDRWRTDFSQASKFSVQQTATVLAGFVNSMKITSLAATSIGASDYFVFSQPIEGNNIADFRWGTASAKTATLTFSVNSSLTGTFGGSIRNGNGTRSYPFTYSVPVANTDTTISITITGDTTGTWATDNSASVTVFFGLGVGSTFSNTVGVWAAGNYFSATGAVSVVGTSGATFYITGVQLEVGSTATSFDVRDYGREFIMCQRYFCQSYPYGNVAGTNNGGQAAINALNGQDGNQIPGVRFPVEMRSAPTTTIYSCSGTAATVSNTSLVDAPNGGTWGFTTAAASGSRAVVGAGGLAAATAYVYHYVASAEL